MIPTETNIRPAMMKTEVTEEEEAVVMESDEDDDFFDALETF